VRIVIKGFEYTLTYVLATNTIFDLSSNNLTGEIPPSIGSSKEPKIIEFIWKSIGRENPYIS
jgi:hypothetical protein